MKDYRVEVKVRNNLLLEKMEEEGIESLKELSEKSGVSYWAIMEYVGLKRSIFAKYGDDLYTPTFSQLMDFFGCSAEEIYPKQNMELPLKKNKASFKASMEDVSLLMSGNESPEDKVFLEDMATKINEAVDKLPERLATIVRMKHGLEPYCKEHTLEEIAAVTENFKTGKIGITRENVRQKYEKAIRMMKHPNISRDLRQTF